MRTGCRGDLFLPHVVVQQELPARNSMSCTWDHLQEGDKGKSVSFTLPLLDQVPVPGEKVHAAPELGTDKNPCTAGDHRVLCIKTSRLGGLSLPSYIFQRTGIKLHGVPEGLSMSHSLALTQSAAQIEGDGPGRLENSSDST